MTNDELRLLWARWLAAEPLSPEEQQALAAALEEDAERRDALLDDLDLDGAMRGLAEGRRRADEFDRTMAAIVSPERDATRFVRKVEAALAGASSRPPTSTKLPAIRATSRFTRRARPGEGDAIAWKVGLAAAALFALVVIAAVGRPKPVAGPVVPRPLPEARVEPAPLPEPKPRVEEVPRPEPKLPAPLPAPERKSERTETEPGKLEVPPMRKPEPGAPTAPSAPPAKPGATASEKAVALELPKLLEGILWHKGQVLKEYRPADAVPTDLELMAHAASGAALEWKDGTRVILAKGSYFRLVADAAARRLHLKSGQLDSSIAAQPAERPMVFETADAQARILGTVIKLSVDGLGTTLEVREGKVRFGKPGGKSVEVGAGQFSVAAPGVEPSAHANLIAEELRFAFGPADTVLDGSRWKLDSGQAFSAARGYGWKPSAYPRQVWKNPTPDAGGVGAARVPNGKPDDLRAGHVAAGWGVHADTWTLPIPNGRYLVRIGVGDSLVEHGPHRVTIEGTLLVPDVITKAPGYYAEFSGEVTVRDGELTMVVGGSESRKVPQDGSLDTILNTLLILRKSK